jgi:hypothetical protein
VSQRAEGRVHGDAGGLRIFWKLAAFRTTSP